MKACYLIVMGFRHLEPIVKISRRRPTLLPAHSQVLVAVSSIELPHDRSRSERIGSGLHSLSRHFYESLLLNCNGLSSFRANCKDKQAATYSAARPLAGARGSLIDRAAARSVQIRKNRIRTSFAEPPFL